MSLGALASAAGIGKGSLSEVENGIRNPTLSTLYALAGTLGVTLSSLLAEQPGATVSSPGIAARLLDVTRSEGWVVEVYRLRLDAGASHHSPAHGRGVTEHFLVTSGRALVGPRGSETALSAGDSAQWVSDGPHAYQALGDEPVESVLVIRSPAAGLSVGPVVIRRLENAEFVAVRITQDVPYPAGLLHRRFREDGRAEAGDPVDFGGQVPDPQVQVEAVLCHLGVRGALEEDLGALAVARVQTPVDASGHASI